MKTGPRQHAPIAISRRRLDPCCAPIGAGSEPLLRVMRIAHPIIGGAWSSSPIEGRFSSAIASLQIAVRGARHPSETIPSLVAQTRKSEAREATGDGPSFLDFAAPADYTRTRQPRALEKLEGPDAGADSIRMRNKRLHMEDGNPWQGFSPLLRHGNRGARIRHNLVIPH
jgi:hypothetical protein